MADALTGVVKLCAAEAVNKITGCHVVLFVREVLLLRATSVVPASSPFPCRASHGLRFCRILLFSLLRKIKCFNLNTPHPIHSMPKINEQNKYETETEG